MAADPLAQTFPDGANLFASNRGAAKPPSSAQAKAILAGLPLMFEPNRGQSGLDPADPRAKFVAHGPGYGLFLGSEGAILALHSSKPSISQSSPRSAKNARSRSVEYLQMKLAGANTQATVTGAEELPGKSSYLIGNDPAKWRSGIPQFARVRYENVYPGINLAFYGNHGRLEYDFQVAPGADPEKAELEFDGAQRLRLENGALVVEARNGSVRFETPQVYQQIAGRRQPVEASFVLRGPHRAGFAVGSYDRSRELVIDPVLTYGTYFGGTKNETSTSVAVQGGFIYLTGATDSPDLITLHTNSSIPYQTTLNGTQNVYLAQIDPAVGGTGGLIYLTYLGGNGTDVPVGIGVDGAGQMYVAGTTSSTNFPTTADAYVGYSSSNSTGPNHVFVSLINPAIPSSSPPSAELIFSSYLSGNGDDEASGMTIDAHGSIYVTGTTTSNNTSTTTNNPAIQFPASALPYGIPFQPAPFATKQFFVTKVLTVDGSGPTAIAYSTYFGGGALQGSINPNVGGGIAVDPSGYVYFTGSTNFQYKGGVVGDFPILNAYQPCLDTAAPATIVNNPTCTYNTNNGVNYNNTDAFVAKLNPNPQLSSGQLLWSTYLGGSDVDSGNGVTVDTAGNVYVTGTTNSYDFVTSFASFAPYQQCLNDEFTITNNVVTCNTQTGATVPTDAYIAKISNPSSGSTTTNVSLTYFSFLGGANNEQGLQIAVDTAQGALLTGSTQSPSNYNPPTPPPAGSFLVSSCAELQCFLVGTQDAFIARINTQTNQNNTSNPLASWVSYYGSGTPSTALTTGTGVAVDVNLNTFFAGNTNSTSNLLTPGALQSANNSTIGGYNAFVAELAAAYNLSITGVLQLGNNQTYISAGNQATFVYTLTNGGPDLASNITVTDFITSQDTGNVQVTANTVSATNAGTSNPCTNANNNNGSVSCTIDTLQAGATSTITVVLTPSGTTQNLAENFNGGNVIVSAPNGTQLAHVQVPAKMSDYSLGVAPNSVAVQTAGDTAVYQVQLTPNGVYSSAISLACSLPVQGTTCTFTNPSVTLNGSSAGSTAMNVTTTARPVNPPAASLWRRQFYAVWLGLPGLALLGFGGKRRRRLAGFLTLCIMALLLFLPACSNTVQQAPVSGTPSGTYTATVTATSGTDTKNASVTLIVP